MNKVLLTFLMFAGAGSAFAQSAELGFHVGAHRLRGSDLGTFTSDPTQPATSYSLKDGWRFGFRVTLNNGLFTGHEAFYGYNRTTLRSQAQTTVEQGMAIHQGGYNFLFYPVPEGSPVRPFVTGGAHFSNFVPPGSSATSGGGDTKFGVNYGAGIKIRISPMFLIRLDVRDYLQGKPFDIPGQSGRLHLLEVSAGFSLAL